MKTMGALKRSIFLAGVTGLSLIVLLGTIPAFGQPSFSYNLSGTWNCDDGGIYYIRQVGDRIWWYGEASPNSPLWSNVFEGEIYGNKIISKWADVPKGRLTNSGYLELEVVSESRIVAKTKTGGFGGSVWTKSGQVIQIPGQASYLGCFKDQGDRDISGFFVERSDMATEQCVSICTQKGFAYASTQYGRQCFCGNSYGKFGPANNCDMKCEGNPNQMCGGFWANSVYRLR